MISYKKYKIFFALYRYYVGVTFHVSLLYVHSYNHVSL